MSYSILVGAARFELATSTSQMWRDNRATLRPENSLLLKLPKVAERVGVEPTVQFNPYDDLANRSFRPLRHLSLIQLFKGWQKYTINLKVKSKNEVILNKQITWQPTEPFAEVL